MKRRRITHQRIPVPVPVSLRMVRLQVSTLTATRRATLLSWGTALEITKAS
jgi:hypothetical protein